MAASDPFTGLWVLDKERSRFESATPISWLQEIDASETDLRVHEQLVTSAGLEIKGSVEAKFNGEYFPVQNSPFLDAIAYQREGATIRGTGKKNEALSLEETLVADGETFTMTFTLLTNARKIASGTAVFRKETPALAGS